MARNKSRMLGRNTMTPPTPPMMPSTRSDLRALSEPFGHQPTIWAPNQPNPSSIHFMGGSPSVKVSWKTRYISPMNMGMPRRRFVATASILSEIVWRSSMVDRTASRHAPEMNPYRRPAMAVSGCSPSIFSIRAALFSSWLLISGVSNLARTALSFSSSFRASHRKLSLSLPVTFNLISDSSRAISSSISRP